MATAQDLMEKAKNLLEANKRVRGAVLDRVGVATLPAAKEKVNISKLKGVSQALIDKVTMATIIIKISPPNKKKSSQIRARETQKTLTTLTTPLQKSQLLHSKLPTLIPILRNIFTTEKKTALELNLVIERIAHSLNCGMERGNN